MNSGGVLLVRDARQTLRDQVASSCASNPLLAVFSEWLGLPVEDDASAEKAVAKAGSAKGGERSSRGAALVGFRCRRSPELSKVFRKQLEWVIGKPNFDTAGEPSGVLVDPIILLGISVGLDAATLPPEVVQGVRAWADGLKADSAKVVGLSDWQVELTLAVLGKLTGSVAAALDSPSWLSAALVERGVFHFRDEHAADVLRQCLEPTDESLDDFEAALRLKALDWSRSRVLDVNLQALAVSDVVRVIRNIPQIFLRWTWEDKPRTAKRGAQPRKWHIENEYHVQSLLYAVLKPVLPELDEEKYLASTGTYQPRADLCLTSLQLVIEVKFWYRNGSVKDLTEQVASDHSLYLRPDSPYRAMVAVIWDEGARTEEHPEFQRGLGGLGNMKGVVLISKPSTWM